MTNGNQFDDLIREMQVRPDDFDIDEYAMEDKRTGLRVWIANGFWFYQLREPFDSSFSLRQKWKFKRALQKLKDAKLGNILNREE